MTSCCRAAARIALAVHPRHPAHVALLGFAVEQLAGVEEILDEGALERGVGVGEFALQAVDLGAVGLGGHQLGAQLALQTVGVAASLGGGKEEAALQGEEGFAVLAFEAQFLDRTQKRRRQPVAVFGAEARRVRRLFEKLDGRPGRAAPGRRRGETADQEAEIDAHREHQRQDDPPTLHGAASSAAASSSSKLSQ